MKHTKLFVLPMLAIGLLVLCAPANAQNSDKGNNKKLGHYSHLTTISIPGVGKLIVQKRASHVSEILRLLAN
jgi:hypothetical protein